MTVQQVFRWGLFSTLAALGTQLVPLEAQAVQSGVVPVESELEVLIRGPVHEAFAETVSFDPEPGIVVPATPPEPIEELPPALIPEGENVDWIPGYWAWGDERNDFLWVSGIWRALPPGRQWVPGYWVSAAGGSQWISGYWADATLDEIDYLPEPPQTMELGPNVEPPSADHTWIPGCWIWQQNRYAWRPGYWATAYANWIWIPDHYVSTPRGYVFIDGYYDYSVARRGVVFAPVYFASNTYAQRGFSYSPAAVINPAVFASHLFLRPSYGHYYFGDYYSSDYSSQGFFPGYTYSRYGYDPFYAHRRWQNRNDRQWDRKVEADYAHRRDHEDARPPRTWAAQQNRRSEGASDTSFVVAASLDEVAKSKESPLRFQAVAEDGRKRLEQRSQEFRRAGTERQTLEAEAVDPSGIAPARAARPYRGKLPRTPVAAQPAEGLINDNAPPQSLEAPQPDLKVEATPRKARGGGKSSAAPGENNRKPRPERSNVERKGTPKSKLQESPEPEPKDPPGPEPKESEPKKAPKPAPKESPKPDSKEPKPAPQETPKPEPKPEPQEAPKPEPQEPKPEPQEAPQPEPKEPAPQEAPKPEPKEAPKPEPQNAPKSGTDEGSKGTSEGGGQNKP